jgi:hypothetical protein
VQPDHQQPCGFPSVTSHSTLVHLSSSRARGVPSPGPPAGAKWPPAYTGLGPRADLRRDTDSSLRLDAYRRGSYHLTRLRRASGTCAQNTPGETPRPHGTRRQARLVVATSARLAGRWVSLPVFSGRVTKMQPCRVAQQLGAEPRESAEGVLLAHVLANPRARDLRHLAALPGQVRAARRC